MDILISRFPSQISEALEIAKEIELHSLDAKFDNILLAGMGGSGIGANFVQSLLAPLCQIPISINKDYMIPAFVSENTLAIVSSYSGNTEETLSAFHELAKAKAKIVCISSGGQLKKDALALGYNYVQVPEGWPAPRACLGYSIVLQLAVLKSAGLCDQKLLDDIISGNHDLIKNQNEIKNEARVVANKLIDKNIIIYSEQKLEPVAVRFRQQFNENSKLLCSHHVVPEMNHNELVGWSGKKEHTVVIIIRDKSENKRNAVRIEITKGILTELADHVIEVEGQSDNYMSRLLYLIHLGDWISWHLADMRGVDVMEIKAINYLKDKLSEI